jgi:hypothetical protein
MTPLFKKLNFKAQESILAINYPKSFEDELTAMVGETTIFRSLSKAKTTEFAICFITTQQEMETLVPAIHAKLKGDALLWLCYPKASSKKYRCDFNRDTGWESLAKLEMEPVRQVAIDEDWSALRFRKVEFIKTITRRESFALTATAKKRTTQKGK